MTLYTRHQLVLVLLLVGAAGSGLAIDHWRRARPEVAERLERVDRAEPAAPGRPLEPPRPPTPRRPLPAVREAPAAPVDVNRASEDELAHLPGIGPALAARIVAARPFMGVEELRRVRGLRRTTLERLQPFVTAGTTVPTAE